MSLISNEYLETFGASLCMRPVKQDKQPNLALIRRVCSCLKHTYYNEKFVFFDFLTWFELTNPGNSFVSVLLLQYVCIPGAPFLWLFILDWAKQSYSPYKATVLFLEKVLYTPSSSWYKASTIHCQKCYSLQTITWN